MKRPRLWITIAVAASVLASKGPQWLAFERGVQAYLYAYPLVIADMTERLMTAPSAIAAHKPGTAPVNQLAHLRDYPDKDFTAVVIPNADTLYSVSWLDLSGEPVLLHTPDMHGRWVLFGVLDAWSNAFAALGTRNYGSAERTYALVGPDWTGTLPDGVARIDSPTKTAWLIGRTYTAGRKDFEAVHRVQDQYSLAPLSQFGKPDAVPTRAEVADPTLDIETPAAQQVAALGPADYFDRLARLMKDNSPAPADAPMVETLASLGIVAGKAFDFEALSKAERRGVEDAVWFVKALFNERIPGSQGELSLGPVSRAVVKGLTQLIDLAKMNVQHRWRIPLNVGVYGTEYTLRALVTLMAYGANVPADAVYPSAWIDSDGNKLNGANRYELHIDKANMPPVEVFWSVSLYTDEYFYFLNPLRRYALGDRDSLKFNEDGSLDIYLQNEKPDADKESNWLPAPPGGFWLVMRLYHPGQAVLNNEWIPPTVKRLAAS